MIGVECADRGVNSACKHLVFCRARVLRKARRPSLFYKCELALLCNPMPTEARLVARLSSLSL